LTLRAHLSYGTRHLEDGPHVFVGAYAERGPHVFVGAYAERAPRTMIAEPGFKAVRSS
jgi:hypothetical protein